MEQPDSKRNDLTPIRGGLPGMYLDGNGHGHICLPEFLDFLNLPDTPENQEWARKEIQRHLDRYVEERFPSIPWREPWPIKLLDGTSAGLGCRLCIARDGLKACDVQLLPQTREQFDQHIQQCH